MRDDGTTFRHVQGDHRECEPPVAAARHTTQILQHEARSGPAQHRLDAGERLGGNGRIFTGDVPADLEIAGAHASLRRRAILAPEAYPAVVDGDDPALTIQQGDVAAEGSEDGRLHQLALARVGFGLLLRERIRKDLPDKTQALHQRVRPGPLRGECYADETTEDTGPR